MTKVDAKIIGQRIAKLRGKKTQADVAAVVGVSVSAIGMYEAGKRVPRDRTKVALAKCFGVSIESLFYDETENTS